MGSGSQQIHFVMIPLLCPGHIIPMIDMAILLAQRDVIITFVSTPHNSVRFGSAMSRAIESGLQIRLLQVRFPSVEVGLPEGCESFDKLPSYKDFALKFFSGIQMLQEPVEKLLGEARTSPSCILSDKHVFWTAETAKKFQIPWIIFDGMSCFTQLCTELLHTSKVHENVHDSDPFIVPGLPDPVEFTKLQLPGLFNPSSDPSARNFHKQIRETEVGAYGVVINSFEELEKNYVTEFKKIKRDKVWCVGPLSLRNKDSLDMAQRGNNATINQSKCLKWLDIQKPGSVVYACLGSLSSLAREQLIELALGLEASGHPFVWVVKAGKQEEVEQWIAEDGFEERIERRGLLLRGWAPQVQILSHFAIGGFLTHCGWNSTIEGICAGVPLITWPLFAEQFFNEKLVVQVVNTGVSVGSKTVVQLDAEEKARVNVKREDVKRAIKCIMCQGEEGRNRRRKAKEFGEKATKAVEEGGSSHFNMTLLIQDIMKHVNYHRL